MSKNGQLGDKRAMPKNYNLQIVIFYVWGIDYMGPLPPSNGCEYILVAVYYVSKWVEAIPCEAAYATTDNIFKIWHSTSGDKRR